MAETRAIDWGAARARIDAAVASTGARSSAEIDRELERRARRLADPPPAAPKTLDAERMKVAFSASGGRYAVSAARVQEVVALPEVVHVPGLPEPWRGVSLHRGRVLPVLDVGALLGHAPAEIADRRRVIVVEAAGSVFALLPDAIEGCVAEEAAAGVFTNEAARGFASEVTEGGLGVLDVEALAGDLRLIVNQEE